MRSVRLLPAALVLVTAPSHACDPNAIFAVRVASTDAPACLVLTPVQRALTPSGSAVDLARTARVKIRNDCTEPASITPKTCDACGPDLTLAPRTSGELVLENRARGDAIDYGKHTRQVSAWKLGARSGSIATDVTVTDDLEACSNDPEKSVKKSTTTSAGCNPCHMSTPRRRDDPWTIAGLVAVFALGVARRWARD